MSIPEQNKRWAHKWIDDESSVQCRVPSESNTWSPVLNINHFAATYFEFRDTPKPLEWWVDVLDDNSRAIFDSEQEARDFADECPNYKFRRIAVHMREVEK